jgi:PEP-CTERM motif
MITTFARAGAFALALSISQVATAVTVFDNGAPNLISGTQMGEFQVAEDFTLSSATNLGTIRFWSIQSTASDYSGSVAWSIFSNSGTQPGTSLFSGVATVPGVAAGGTTGFGYAAYVFDIPVTLSLAAGTYWLGLHNGPLTNTAPREMLWATTGTGLGAPGLYLDGTWVDSGNAHAFRLESAAVVPEAGTSAMLLAGLVGLAGLRLSRRAGVATLA